MVRRMGGGNNLMAAKVILGHAAIDDFKLLRASGYSHCRIGYKMDERSGERTRVSFPKRIYVSCVKLYINVLKLD